MGTKKAIRNIVRDRLYTDFDINDSTTTGVGSTSTLVDAGLVSSMLGDDNYVGAWILMTAGAAINEAAKVSQNDRATGTLTLTPVLSAASGSASTYEVHRFVHPARLDEAINWALRVGSRYAHAGLTDETTSQTALPDDVVAEGALAYVKTGLSKSRSKQPYVDVTSEGRQQLREEALFHIAAFKMGVKPIYGEIVIPLLVAERAS